MVWNLNFGPFWWFTILTCIHIFSHTFSCIHLHIYTHTFIFIHPIWSYKYIYLYLYTYIPTTHKLAHIHKTRHIGSLIQLLIFTLAISPKAIILIWFIHLEFLNINLNHQTTQLSITQLLQFFQDEQSNNSFNYNLIITAIHKAINQNKSCLLYTSDAADE